MTSSGIKRGLAATAISALAVAGSPLLASTANAAVGDSFTVPYTGPALNGGDEGALVILRAKDGTIDPTKLELTGTGSTTVGSQNTGDQNAEINDAQTTVVQDSSAAAYEFIKVYITTTTATTGDAATFRIFEDDSPTNAALDASEARQTVSISTAGPLASVVVTPTSQTEPQGVESGDYTVALQDSAGRATQLPTTDWLNITDNSGATIGYTETGPETDTAGDQVLTAAELVRGTDTFTANGSAVGTWTITVADNTVPTVKDTAQLVVTQAAVLTANDIDIVTGADTWDGPGDGTDGGTTFVQVNQSTIRVDINAPDAQKNSYVQADVTSGDVTFGGKNNASYTTTLDSHGDGSITIQVDPASIQDGDTFTLSMNGFDQTFSYERSDASAGDITADQDPYICKVGTACTVTVQVTDQFGNPVTTGYVEGYIYNGPDTSTPPYQRKPVGSDGSVSFTFTDTEATNGAVSDLEFDYYADQFSNTSSNSGFSSIKWTTTGQGADYTILIDGDNTEAPTYDPADETVIPLTDTDADNSSEWLSLDLSGCENGTAVNVSVDNGGLLLTNSEELLSEGQSSVTTSCGGGALNDSLYLIGTTSGLVTVTVDSANRTESAQYTVSKQDDEDTSRNVSVSGPATVPHGTTQIDYTALVTDAFGNPVSGVEVNQWPFGESCLKITVSGPGSLQDNDTLTDANGMLNFTVKVDNDAAGTMTPTVTGQPDTTARCFAQFGAAADRQYASSTTDDGVGLPVSSNVGTASTTVEAAPAGPHAIIAHLGGHNNGARADRLKVTTGDTEAAGATVKLFRVKHGVRHLVGVKNLNVNGAAKFKAADKNGRSFTKYVATVGPTANTMADTSNAKRVR